MTRDASLTEFGVGGDEEETERGDDDTAAATDDGDATSTADGDGDTPEPVRPTSRWRAAAASCPDCGATVQRTWAADSRNVCADCKEW